MKILSYILRFSLLPVLSGMCIVSCSKEMAKVNDNAEVTFTAAIQEDILTRACGDGKSVNKLVIGVFNLDENRAYSEREDLRHYEDISDGKIGDITLSLAKSETYHFIFWAYNSDSGIYNVDNLTAIKMNNGITGFEQAEKADAFFATVNDFTVTENTVKKISLTRPLAQINVGTSGKATKALFKVRNAADTFHPFTRTVSGDVDFTWTFEETTDETFMVDGMPYTCIATGYVFAPIAEATQKTCELALAETDKNTTFQSVMLRANHRSNIVGSFMSKDTED